jgi:hypothetical protein
MKILPNVCTGLLSAGVTALLLHSFSQTNHVEQNKAMTRGIVGEEAYTTLVKEQNGNPIEYWQCKKDSLRWVENIKQTYKAGKENTLDSLRTLVREKFSNRKINTPKVNSRIIVNKTKHLR